MRRVGLLICSFALVVLVGSCNEDDTFPASGIRPEGDPLEVAVSGDCTDALWYGSVGGATRVKNTTFTTGDAVGIYMVSSGNYTLSSALYKNRQYTVNASGQFSPASGQALYYPYNGSSVNFVAYCPYDASAHTNSNKRTIDFTEQNNLTKKESKDFVFHKGTTAYSKGGPGVELKFYHKFSKIRMTVNKGSGGPSLTNLVVKLTRMPKTATVDLAALATNENSTAALGITASTTTTISAFTESSNDGTAIVEAILPPHSGSGSFTGRTITFEAGGETKTYDLPDTQTFAMGMVYNYTFSLEAGVTNTTSDGMTNCYMLGYNTALTFPVKRAYENNGSSTTLRIGGTHTGTFTIEKLWDDNDVISACSVTGNGNAAVISVTTNNSNRSGNAVVAIKAGSNIAWSYHIWVTGYDPDDENAAEHATFTNTYNTNNNGGHFTFMDRNLGATFAGTGSGKGTGLFYQWGRKDPFPATDGAGATTTGSFSFAATSATLGTIPNTIRNPNVFYSAASTPNDWHYAGKIDTLWNHSNNNKTIYDPCPAGWRVPSCAANNNAYGPWNGLSSSGLSFTSGYAYETNAVYPANGLRNTYETGYMGKVWNVGVQGFIWTGSTKNNNGIAYDYMAGRNAQNAEHYRGHGICVRCARE